MEPNAYLIAYGLSVLANITTEQIKKISLSGKFNREPLRDLYLKSFYTALDYHEKAYDESAKKITKKIRRAIKKDNSKLISILCTYSGGFEDFLSSIKKEDFKHKIAAEIIDGYSIKLMGKDTLIYRILTDSLSFFSRAFFNLMNDKEGIQTVLLECLKIDNILHLLKIVDSKSVTKADFDELKMIAYKNYFSQKPEEKKKLVDYDNYLKNKFRYIENRGF